jgi:hypothetical protein
MQDNNGRSSSTTTAAAAAAAAAAGSAMSPDSFTFMFPECSQLDPRFLSQILFIL